MSDRDHAAAAAAEAVPPTAPLILGVSGLRGIVGESLTPEVVVRYAAVFGTWLYETLGAQPVVLLGRDGRAGGEAFEAAACAGLLAAGCRVVKLGVVMTPTVGVCAEAYAAQAGVMITASHNPQVWNGLKCMVADEVVERAGGSVDRASLGGGLFAPPARLAEEIVRRYLSGSVRFAPPWAIGTSRNDVNPAEVHLHRVVTGQPGSAVGIETVRSWGPGRRVVVDSVNASGTRCVEALLTFLGIATVQLAGSSSGLFPHVPEPTKENLSGAGGLCDAVVGLKADIGFAQDPDADRLAIVDEKGVYIGEEYTLSIAAEALLSHRESLKATIPPHVWKQTPVIVVNLSTSRMVDDVAARYGAEVIRTPVGEANVVERMKQLADDGRNVIVGGEGNGGVIWPKVCYVRDSLSAMALTLGLMARTGTSVSQIVDRINSYSPGGRGYCIVKRKTEIPSKAAAAPACEAVARAFAAERVDRQDGVRVDFSGKWAGCWVHVRASNTEPIMRLICEAPNETLAAEVLRATERAIAGG